MPGIHEPLTEPLLDAAFHAGDPHPHYARLRTEAPMAWHGGVGAWIASRHADVLAASTDPATFCSGRGILVEEIGRVYDSPPTMMHTDPPDHNRYRALVSPAFRPGIVRAMETAVRGRVTTLLDACDGDEVVDVVSQLAIPFPLQVICSMLGLPDDDLDRLFAWSEAAIPGAGDYSDDERMTLLGEMTMFLLDLAASRRHAATPGGAGGDIVSTLAEVRIDGEQLRDDELAMFLIQLLVAGNETTRNALSGGLVALAQHPDELARLRADPSLIPSAVEEVLRWTTPVVSFMRTATCDTTLGGAAISAGDPVLLLYAAANRDADAFGPTAARFDVGRDPNHHVALGFGIHFCLGAALARLELRAALEEVLGRWAHLELAGDVVRSGSSVIAGVRRAPLRVSR